MKNFKYINSCQVSGSKNLGVLRSKEIPERSLSFKGLVRPSNISCMKGRLLTGSFPSMYALKSDGERSTTG